MLCSVCLKNEVAEGEDSIDYCLDCHFSGRRFEMFLLSEERSNVLGRIRAIDQVSTAAVWHVGNGLFNLGIMLKDGRAIIPGVGITVQGQVLVQAAVPPLGVPWGISVIAPSLTDPMLQEQIALQETFDDDELVTTIEELSRG